MKIVTWNIAGGHTVRSNKHFDYAEEDIAYIIAQLAACEADIICLQEVHSNEQRSLAQEIAKQLGDYTVFESPLSPSHIDKAFKLGLAILAKGELQETVLHTYPLFPAELHFADGRPASQHTKGFQIARYQDIAIMNTNWLPLTTFGFDHATGFGKTYVAQLEQMVLATLSSPVILCGDFSVEVPLSQLMPELFKTLRLRDALPSSATFHRPNASGQPISPDHICFSAELKKIDAGVTPTNTDHYLCWASLDASA